MSETTPEQTQDQANSSDKSKPDAVPYERFQEVNQKHKQASDQLKALQSQHDQLAQRLAEYEQAKAKAEQEEAIKRGDFESLLATQKTKLAEMEASHTGLKSQLENYQSVVASLVEAELSALPDNLKLLVDSDDPLVKLNQLTKLKQAGLLTSPPPSPVPNINGARQTGQTRGKPQQELDPEVVRKIFRI